MASLQPKPDMKERILQTADRLFYLDGIRAVGVDTIAAAIGISKRTLYNHFPSKDALISAYLERRFVHASSTAVYDLDTEDSDIRGELEVEVLAVIGRDHKDDLDDIISAEETFCAVQPDCAAGEWSKGFLVVFVLEPAATTGGRQDYGELGHGR